MKKQHLRRLLPILLLLAALILPASGLAEDVTAYLSGLTASVTQNGVPVTGGALTDDPVNVKFSFGVPVLGDEPVPANPVMKGDYAEFPLSSGFSLESGSEFKFMSGDILVGHVKIITEKDEHGVKQVRARVDFDGDDDVFNGELHTVSCYFNAKFSYDSSGSGGGTGEDTVSILNKEYTVVIPPGEITYRVLKRGEVNLADGTITWTATVNAVQGGTPIDLGGYIFEDDLIGAGVYETGTFAVGDASQTPTYEEDKLTYTFPAGVGPKTITYQTKIPDEKYYAFGEQTLTNRAALKDSDERELKSDEATVTFDPGWIVKSGASNETPGGVYNPKDRTITWTIDITNPNPNVPMTGVKVTDALPAGLTFASATVAYDTGTGLGADEPITPTGDVYDLNTVRNAAQLVIVAEVPDDPYTVGVTTYTNSASVSWDGLPVGINGIGTGGVGVGIGFVPITKSGTANTEKGQITWTVNVDTRGQNIPDLKVYDLLVYGDDASVLPDTLPGGIALSDLTPRFNQRYADWDSGSAGLSNAVIPVTNGGTRVADLIEVTGLANNAVNTFTFTSQILDPDILAGNDINTVSNTATLFSGSTRLNAATARVPYDGTSLKKSMLSRGAALAPINPNGVTTNLAEGFNYQDKTVVFRLSVNVNGMDLTNLENAGGQKSGTITITDTLPAGWVYTEFTDGGFYKLLAGTTDVTASGVITAGSPVSPLPTSFTASVSGSTATFSFTELKDRYVILLRATPTSDEAAELFNDNKTTTVDNTVTMTAQNWTGFDPSSTQSVSVKSELAGKTATVGKNPEGEPTGEATWTLDYRPYDIDHLQSSPAHIIDTIPAGVELRTNAAGGLVIPGNIKVYPLTLTADGTYTVGAEIDDLDPFAISYGNASRQLRFNIPAGNIAQGYRFTYITDITGEPGTRVTNTATLHGKKVGGTEVSDSFVISDSDSGATVGRGGRLSIDKRGALGRALSGVEFTLFGSNDGGSTYTVPIRSGITDSNGELNLRVIPVGDYILKETKVPDPAGYYPLSATTYAVEVINEENTIITRIDGNPAKTALRILNLTNEDNRTAISATKTWVGGKMSDHVPVTLTLYANDAAIDNAIFVPTISAGVVVGNTTVYTHTWSDLPVKDINDKTITYTVKELDVPDGYRGTPTYDKTDPDNIKRGVTNEYIFKATKTWVDGRYATKPTLWLKLYRHIEGDTPTPVDIEPQQLTNPSYLSNNGTATATWYGLDMEDDDGNPYIYTVVEGTYVSSTDTFTPSPTAPTRTFPWQNTYDAEAPKVTNTYDIPLTGSAAAQKEWQYGTHTRPTVWFQLMRHTSAATTPEVVPGAEVKALPNGTTGASWSGLEKTDRQGRNYIFTVVEGQYANGVFTPGTPNHYTSQTSSDGLKITNTYQASGSWTPAVKKTLDGRDLKDKEFYFQLRRGLSVLQTKTNNADGDVAFDAINYTAADIGKEYTYTIREVKTPSLPGVSYTDLIIYATVTISDAGNGQLGISVVYDDDENEIEELIFGNTFSVDVTFSKVAAGQTEELPGATLTVKVKDKDGNMVEVESWTSDGTVKVLQLTAGEYTMTEDQAPLGYDVAKTITFRVNPDGSVEIKEGENWVSAADAKIQMVDELTKRDVTFSKVAAGQTEELKGAKITVSGTDINGGTFSATWTSGGTAKVLQLPAGEYTMTEDQAPLGYAVAADITFRVNLDGTVRIKEGGTWVDAVNAKIQMVDELTPYDVTFSKVAAGQGTELAGADLTVKKADGTVVATWPSEGTAKVLQLPAGEYTMIEDQAPLGYAVAADITFRVNLDGTVQIKEGGTWVDAVNAKIQMVDELTPYDVTFSKVAAGQGTELAGADLTVKKADGTVVATWPSDGTAKVLQLPAGEYTMIEDQAPLGYAVAADITFRVNLDGTVQIKEGETWVSAEDAKIQMVDELTEYDVTFSKVAAGQTEELAGATLTVKDENGDVVKTWTSTGTAEVLQLTAGEYTMIEDQAPLGYDVAETITFKVNMDGSVEIKEGDNWVSAATAKVQMVDELTPAPTPRPTTPPTPTYPAISVPVTANKNLSGRQLKAGEFTFLLKDASGKVLDTVTNDAQGNITFKSRTFSKTGVFLYTIAEVKGDDKKVTYDTTIFTLRIETTASGGKLSAQVSILKDGVPYAGDVTFNNRYSLPQTGDSQPQLMLILAAAGLMALMAGVRLRKKYEN